MDHCSIVLRAARPDSEEGLAFARYLDQAAEGFIHFMLGPGTDQIVAQAFTQPDNEYSYENVTFAEHSHDIVGMGAGFTGVRHRSFSDRPLKQAAGYPALRMTAVRLFFAPMFRILSTVPDDDFYLLSIAIDEGMRGAGIGSLLMDSFEERARTAGAARISLDVSARNEGARKLYERRGMTVESQWPGIRLVPPLFLRMAKTL